MKISINWDTHCSTTLLMKRNGDDAQKSGTGFDETAP